MKKVINKSLIILLLLTLCVGLFSCSSSVDGGIHNGMDIKAIFDLIAESDSYSIDINPEFYRFVKGEGYTIYDSGIFEGYFLEGDTVYTINMDENGISVYKEEKPSNFEAKVSDKYDEYVLKLRETFHADDYDTTELKMEISGTVAYVTYIAKSTNELSIERGSIYGIGETTLQIHASCANYKELAVEKQ